MQLSSPVRVCDLGKWNTSPNPDPKLAALEPNLTASQPNLEAFKQHLLQKIKGLDITHNFMFVGDDCQYSGRRIQFQKYLSEKVMRATKEDDLAKFTEEDVLLELVGLFIEEDLERKKGFGVSLSYLSHYLRDD